MPASRASRASRGGEPARRRIVGPLDDARLEGLEGFARPILVEEHAPEQQLAVDGGEGVDHFLRVLVRPELHERVAVGELQHGPRALRELEGLLPRDAACLVVFAA